MKKLFLSILMTVLVISTSVMTTETAYAGTCVGSHQYVTYCGGTSGSARLGDHTYYVKCGACSVCPGHPYTHTIYNTPHYTRARCYYCNSNTSAGSHTETSGHNSRCGGSNRHDY